MAKNLGKRPATPASIDAPAAAAESKTETAEEKRLRQNLPPPKCPYHHGECRSNRSDPLFTRYYCPETGCTYSQKVPRPAIEQLIRRREQQEEGFSAR